jgi:hypothetical protein
MLISKDVNANQFLNDRLWREAVVDWGALLSGAIE